MAGGGGGSVSFQFGGQMRLPSLTSIHWSLIFSIYWQNSLWRKPSGVYRSALTLCLAMLFRQKSCGDELKFTSTKKFCTSFARSPCHGFEIKFKPNFCDLQTYASTHSDQISSLLPKEWRHTLLKHFLFCEQNFRMANGLNGKCYAQKLLSWAKSGKFWNYSLWNLAFEIGRQETVSFFPRNSV